VFEYAYGPRAQASIGMEPGLVTFVRPDVVTHVGFYALAALENGTDTRLFPPSNGKGLLVDRRELRLSFGVRYAVF
jgi:hypothetical protein